MRSTTATAREGLPRLPAISQIPIADRRSFEAGAMALDVDQEVAAGLSTLDSPFKAFNLKAYLLLLMLLTYKSRALKHKPASMSVCFHAPATSNQIRI